MMTNAQRDDLLRKLTWATIRTLDPAKDHDLYRDLQRHAIELERLKSERGNGDNG
jgi:hypothetical protein